MFDKNYIETRIKELQKEYCPTATIIQEYPTSYYDSEAELDVGCLKHGLANFILKVYPSFEKNNEKDFILRHELLHIKDMLDPLFCFDYGFLFVVHHGCDAFKPILSKVIWDITIDMRLKRIGHLGGIDYEERINNFKKNYIEEVWIGYGSIFAIDLGLIQKIVDDNRITLLEIKRIATEVRSDFTKRIAKSTVNKNEIASAAKAASIRLFS